MSDSRLLSKLNPQQKEAVLHRDGPLLILAGAGSGKTRVLTHRMSYLLENGVSPTSILSVTFTNQAAEEMKKRVMHLVGESRSHRLLEWHLWVTTFHSGCLRILRSESEHIGIKRNFTVYDSQDQLVLVKECFKELDINEKQLNPKAVREAISRAKDYLQTPDDVARKAQDFQEEQIGKVYKLYEQKLKALNGLDFGDLIFKAVVLFEKCPEVLKQYQQKFEFIQVDEYQDTNAAQYRWLKLLASLRKNIVVVGDPDQAIYEWRGADISNILSFEHDYPNAKVVKLEQNYRSTNVILQASNQLIRSNSARKHKDLWGEQGEGEAIQLYEAMDERDEAQAVVKQILDLVSQGTSLGEMVIFYRVHAQSRILEDLLRRYKIPYKIVAGIRFYDRKEIKDLISYLRLVSADFDDLSVKRVINVPARGVGKKALKLLEANAAQKKVSLFRILAEVETISGFTARSAKSIADFYQFILSLREKKKDAKISDMLHEILSKTGYMRELEMEGTIEAKSRIENIKEFFTVVYEFEENTTQENEGNTLEAFLESITLHTDLDDWENEDSILTLMTVHAAKGLEFSQVFIVGLEEEIFPHASAIEEGPASIEEERRLCYVGMTRAKHRLYLSFANRRRLYGYAMEYFPSRFLNEIPSELVEQTQPEYRYEREPDY